MIKCNFDNVSLKGSAPMICAEVENILRALRECLNEALDDEDAVEDMINEVIANSKMSLEEVNDKADKVRERVTKELSNEDLDRLEKFIKKELKKMRLEADDYE